MGIFALMMDRGRIGWAKGRTVDQSLLGAFVIINCTRKHRNILNSNGNMGFKINFVFFQARKLAVSCGFAL